MARTHHQATPSNPLVTVEGGNPDTYPPQSQSQQHHQHQQQYLFPPPPPPPFQQQQQQHYSVPNPNVPPPPPLPSVFPTPAAGAAAATLLVRHLPEAIPHDMLSRLFTHCGASSVRPCAGGKLRNCAFVDFKDDALASQAQAQLNRLKFLGKILTVERVGSSTKKTGSQSDSQARRDSSGPASSSLKDSSNTGNSVYGGEPIAPRVGVDYPFPPHLEYAYPPPDGNILTNIVSTLVAVPRFYTQVLHLMNKMNLPAPFRVALPTPPLPLSVPAPPPPPPITVECSCADLSSDESELESSEDDVGDNRIKKRVKRESIVGPAIDKGVAYEAVGLKPVSLVRKEVPLIKKKNPVLQIKIAPKPTLKDIADDGNNIKELTVPVQEQDEQKPYAMPEDIEKGKLPLEEILSLPMFKNYASGSPAMVLYIKNLAKDVVADDFYFIFGSLFESLEAAKSGLHFKLMQERRMRGQAFVTFPSIGLAQRALNLVNGSVFKGKPMIIQFGRNPAAGKPT